MDNTSWCLISFPMVGRSLSTKGSVTLKGDEIVGTLSIKFDLYCGVGGGLFFATENLDTGL